jgi:hypothetical protein
VNRKPKTNNPDQPEPSKPSKRAHEIGGLGRQLDNIRVADGRLCLGQRRNSEAREHGELRAGHAQVRAHFGQRLCRQDLHKQYNFTGWRNVQHGDSHF